ncbi:MAG TPA: DUF4097 family beta strand repeat-containing protein [Methanomicrobiales archaeon]|nr:DUF4097 family beta strand repeat-containing protein [Methanomicrobiales archaeon]
MIPKYTTILALSCLVGLLAVSGCVFPGFQPGPQVTETFNQTYPAGGVLNLDVASQNGYVHVSGWDQDVIWVHAVKRSLYGQTELNKVNITVETGQNLTVRTVHPLTPAQVSVDYDIKVPMRNLSTIGIDTSNGAIQVEGVAANANAATSNGRIDMRNIVGNVEAYTSNGAVDIRNINGSAFARSSNARINILNTTSLRGAYTSNGQINVEIYSIPPATTTLQTSNGAINAALSPNLNATILAETSNGAIRVQNISITVQEQTGTLLRGTIGSGGPQIHILTSNGGIFITRVPLTGV